jgi:hypothetical protein
MKKNGIILAFKVIVFFTVESITFTVEAMGCSKLYFQPTANHAALGKLVARNYTLFAQSKQFVNSIFDSVPDLFKV